MWCTVHVYKFSEYLRPRHALSDAANRDKLSHVSVCDNVSSVGFIGKTDIGEETGATDRLEADGDRRTIAGDENERYPVRRGSDAVDC